MSRIHEALRRATEERAAQLEAGLELGTADVTAGVPHPLTAEPAVAPPPGLGRVNGSGHSAVPLRYEDLLKRCTHPEWHLDPQYNVFQNPQMGGEGSERFRTLRSRLYQIAATRQLRRLLVTSGVPAEGKTFVASNLARSMVRQPEQRVLLLDADLRMPRLHVALGAPSHPGLVDYLRGEADEYAIVQKGMEENLCLIPGGSQASNPSELLLSERMKHLLDLLTPVFDWIIVDSSPALPVHDAIVLADMMDGVLLVCRAGSTDLEIAEKTVAEFRDKKLLGVVLNQARECYPYGSYYFDSYVEGVERSPQNLGEQGVHAGS